VVACLLYVLDGSQLGRLAGRDLAADPEGLGHQLPGAGQTVLISEFLEDADGGLGLRLGVGRPAIQVADEVQPCPRHQHLGLDRPVIGSGRLTPGPVQDLAGPVELAQLTEGVGEVGQEPAPAGVALG
jgi:hypothetical protein